MASSVIKNRAPIMRSTHITLESITGGNWVQGKAEYRETGYTCFPINVGEYRSGQAFAIKIKQMTVGQVVFDYENLGTATINNPEPYIYWLCIPN